MKQVLIAFVILLSTASLFAQTERSLVRKGNKLYKQAEYYDAAVSYQKAVDENPKSDKAVYNLGNAYYQQQNFEEALQHYGHVGERTHNPKLESKSLYNAGNSLLSQEKYAESIPYFKQALRRNPSDEDARYNLAYAMAKMTEQQNQSEENQQGENEDKEQQEQDQQSGDQNEDEQDDQQDNQDQQQQNQDEQSSSQDKSQPDQQPQLSKEDAERMLQALTEEEKKTLENLQNQQMKQLKGVNKEKDW